MEALFEAALEAVALAESPGEPESCPSLGMDPWFAELLPRCS